jgi:hypothetical protein
VESLVVEWVGEEAAMTTGVKWMEGGEASNSHSARMPPLTHVAQMPFSALVHEFREAWMTNGSAKERKNPQ